MVFGLCGCALVSRVEVDGAAEPAAAKFEAESLHVPTPVPEEEAPEDIAVSGEGEVTEEEETVASLDLPQIKEDDPMYEDVSKMLQGITPVFSYFALNGEDMDLSNLSAEDFWLLMAMICAEVNGDGKDVDGSVSMRQDVLADYAACFFGNYFSSHGLPDWKGTTSASADPRSQVISLSAMGVDSYHGRLAGFEASPDQDGLYDLYLEIYWSVIEGAQTGSEISETLMWKVVLNPWPEGSDHAFAFRMDSFERVDKEALMEASEEPSEEVPADSAD